MPYSSLAPVSKFDCRQIAAMTLVFALAATGLGCSGDDASTHERRASELLAEGQVEAALLELRTAAQRAPDDARLQLHVAEVLRDHDRADEAVAVSRGAHYLMPDDSDTARPLAQPLVGQAATAPTRCRDALHSQDPTTFAPHETVPFAVKRTAGALGLVVTGE